MIQKYLTYSSLALGIGTIIYALYAITAKFTGYDTSYTANDYLPALFMGLAICFFGLYINIKSIKVKEDEYYTAKKREGLKTSMTGFIVSSLLVILMMFLTSCGTQGYGCRGKESWDKMVRRINNGSRP